MILLVTGRKRAGKDTFARHLCAELPGTSTVALADALREVCSIALGIPVETFVDDDLKDAPCVDLPDVVSTPREALIHIGTRLFRDQVHPDTWTRAAIARIRQKLADGAKHVVVTDWRMENELALIQSTFGRTQIQTVLVVRPDLPAPTEPTTHVTEQFATQNSDEATRTFPFDHVVVNDADGLAVAAKVIAGLLCE